MELMEQKELETIYVAAPKNFHSNRQSEEELKRRMFGNYPIKKCFITDNTKFSFFQVFLILRKFLISLKKTEILLRKKQKF